MIPKGLPANIDAEKLILGSILLDSAKIERVADALQPVDLALEAHRRIYQRMLDLFARRESIDRAMLAHELMRHNELESVGGLSYLVSLDDGLPQLPNVDSYIRIVKDMAMLRGIAIFGQRVMMRALTAEDSPRLILEEAAADLIRLQPDGAEWAEWSGFLRLSSKNRISKLEQKIAAAKKALA